VKIIFIILLTNKFSKPKTLNNSKNQSSFFLCKNCLFLIVKSFSGKQKCGFSINLFDIKIETEFFFKKFL
jgi:hypothetical protein